MKSRVNGKRYAAKRSGNRASKLKLRTSLLFTAIIHKMALRALGIHRMKHSPTSTRNGLRTAGHPLSEEIQKVKRELRFISPMECLEVAEKDIGQGNERTSRGHLRHSWFLRLLDDK